MIEAKDWPRTQQGTLRCPCSKTGVIFPQVDIYMSDDLEWYGALGGYCSEECYRKGTAAEHPVPQFEAALPSVVAEPRLF